MHIKSIFIVILLLLSCIVFALGAQLVKAEPKTWYVNDDGGADFTTIGEAISAAWSGDTIFVHNGTYHEHVMIAYKSRLALIGESKYGTIIDGSGFGSIIKILDSIYVTICNFTIRNGGWGGWETFDSAIYLKGASLCDISNNIIHDASCGILDMAGCQEIRIVGNNISNCSNGIVDNYPINVKIVGNCISNLIKPEPDVARYGIQFQGDGINNTIVSNIITGYADYAIAIRYADENFVADNIVTDSFYGIELSKGSCHNNVTGNVLSGNGVGIVVSEESNNNLITENDVSGSVPVDSYISDIGIWIQNSENTTVHHNSFVNNTAQALIVASSGTIWDDGYPSGGNYWSDYTGVDLNDDIIGDTPYIIDADNVDNYPFMYRRCCHPCDINGDGKVDMADVAEVCRAFGTYPSHCRWSSTCDVNGDSRVNMMDVALTVRKLGWHR